MARVFMPQVSLIRVIQMTVTRVKMAHCDPKLYFRVVFLALVVSLVSGEHKCCLRIVCSILFAVR